MKRTPKCDKKELVYDILCVLVTWGPMRPQQIVDELDGEYTYSQVYDCLALNQKYFYHIPYGGWSMYGAQFEVFADYLARRLEYDRPL